MNSHLKGVKTSYNVDKFIRAEDIWLKLLRHKFFLGLYLIIHVFSVLSVIYMFIRYCGFVMWSLHLPKVVSLDDGDDALSSVKLLQSKRDRLNLVGDVGSVRDGGVKRSRLSGEWIRC